MYTRDCTVVTQNSYLSPYKVVIYLKHRSGTIWKKSIEVFMGRFIRILINLKAYESLGTER